MPTLQSKWRPKKGHPANAWKKLPPEQGVKVLRARRERRDAARRAGPAPIYPPDRRPGQYAGYIEIHDAINGWTIRRDLAVPSDRGQRRARVDSLTMVHAGQQLATGGWHALFRFLVGKVLPIPMSLRTIVGLER
jgi:hypothetical protein